MGVTKNKTPGYCQDSYVVNRVFFLNNFLTISKLYVSNLWASYWSSKKCKAMFQKLLTQRVESFWWPCDLI